MSKEITTLEQAKQVFLEMVGEGRYCKKNKLKAGISQKNRIRINLIKSKSKNPNNVTLATYLYYILAFHKDNYSLRPNKIVGEGEE